MLNKKNLSAPNTILYFAFFISGFCALLYQVAWQRMLSLYLGSDVISATIVIASFLAGLGLGNLVASRFIHLAQFKQLTRLFASSQIGIAIFAILSKWIFYDFLFLRLSVFSLDRFGSYLVVFLLLAVPTTLMGITLPVLSQAVSNSVKDAPARISRLNGVNILGSVLGSLLSGWLFITIWGFEVTVYFGAILSLASGITTFLAYSRRSGGEKSRKPIPAASKSHRRSDGGRGWVLYVFLAGFIAISLEIVWFRLISPLIASDAYTFAHLLAFVLVGYASGNLIGSRYVDRIVHVKQTLLLIQIAIVLYSITSILILVSLGHDPGITSFFQALRRGVGIVDFGTFLLGYFLLPGLLLLPANFLIGFYFPLIQKAVQTNRAFIGQRVAIIQISNIVGNVLGSTLTGLVLFDLVGTSGTLRLLALVGLGFATALLLEKTTLHRMLAAASVFSLGFIAFAFPSNVEFWAQVNRLVQGNINVIMVAEDSTGVSTMVSSETSLDVVAIQVNGRGQGLIPYSQETAHTYLGYLAALLHPSPEMVFVIGIGSGNTPVMAGASGQTERIYAVEIVGSEIPLLQHAVQLGFTQVSIFFTDPRFEVLITDGRRALMSHPAHIDVIEADAILPRQSGSGFLFSREFFETQLAKLSDDGYVVQWSPTMRTRRTFALVFPHVLEFPAVRILIGSKQPIHIDAAEIQDRFERDSFMQNYLTELGIEIDVIDTLSQLRPLVMCDIHLNPELANDINTDLHPRDEYFLFDAIAEGNLAKQLLAIEDPDSQGDLGNLLFLYRQITNRAPTLAMFDQWINIAKRSDDPASAIEPLQKAISLLECETLQIQGHLSFADQGGLLTEGLEQRLVGSQQNAYNHMLELADLANRLGNFELAEFSYGQAAMYDFADTSLFSLLGNSRNRLGDLVGAIEAYENAILLSPDDVRLLTRIGQIHFQLGSYDAALPKLERAAELSPDDYQVRFSLGEVYAALEMTDEAIDEFELVLLLTDDFDYRQAVMAYLEELTR